MYNFSFCFRLNLLINSSHVHIVFNVKLDDHTLCLYNVPIRNVKQTSFEVVTFSQTKLQL